MLQRLISQASQFAKASHVSQVFRGLLFALLCTSSSGQDENQTREELESVASAIDSIQSWLSDANEQQSREQQQLREAELQVSAVRQRQDELQRQIAVTQAELETLSDRQAALNSEKERLSQALADVMRALYITRDDNTLKLILNQQDPSEAARILHYANVYSAHQIEQLTAFNQTLRELDNVNDELARQLHELDSQQSELANQAQALEAAQQQRASALAALNADIANRSSELEQLEVNQAELQALLDEIIRAMEGISSFADVPPFAEQRGRLPLPVDARISSAFGTPYGGGSLNRQGIILSSSVGSPVRAVHAGRVVFADWLRGAGLLVIVDHGDGFMSLYGANEALSAEAGQWVDRGDVIATSGSASQNSEPGLYFEIRQAGRPVDPVNWIAR
ncbi:MAG: peptidoglycan DD-metalloendopeptidase family protein [Gammaproteobacteria bacterium]